MDRDELKQYLLSYEGSNKFMLSLQLHVQAGRMLTWKQVDVGARIAKAERGELSHEQRREMALEKLERDKRAGRISNTNYAFETSMMIEYPDYVPGVGRVYRNRAAHSTAVRGKNK